MGRGSRKELRYWVVVFLALLVLGFTSLALMKLVVLNTPLSLALTPNTSQVRVLEARSELQPVACRSIHTDMGQQQDAGEGLGVG